MCKEGGGNIRAVAGRDERLDDGKERMLLAPGTIPEKDGPSTEESSFT